MSVVEALRVSFGGNGSLEIEQVRDGQGKRAEIKGLGGLRFVCVVFPSAKLRKAQPLHRKQIRSSEETCIYRSSKENRNSCVVAHLCRQHIMF